MGILTKVARIGVLLAASAVLAAMAAAQSQQQPDQSVPDAPSSSRPLPQFPQTPPKAAPIPRDEPAPTSESPAPAGRDIPVESQSGEDQPAPLVPKPAPLPPKTQAQEDLYRFVTVVTNVVVPVTVQDQNGRLVNGLQAKDFTLLEDNVKQKLNFFSSDPLAISAAVVFDLGMPDITVRKLVKTFPALEGAFSQYDEVGLYTYSTAVRKVSDFGALGEQFTAVLNSVKTQRGRNNGPPVLGGPLGSAPSINGHPLDPGGPIVLTPAKESHVLNDAVLQAAIDLGKRDRSRRKVIFIISDGRESRSRASYEDVLKVLLTSEIQVYAIATDVAAFPVLRKLEGFHLPRQGFANILPKYASATGGEVFSELSQQDVETAYSRAMGDARNQYTLVYASKATPGGAKRTIDVLVARKGLTVRAKDGFYALPPPK